MSILPTSIDFKSEFPKQSRRLRLGVGGGGRNLQDTGDGRAYDRSMGDSCWRVFI